LDKGDVVKAALEKKHGSGTVEIVVVEGMEVEGAFDEAVKGQHTRIQPHVFHVIANNTKALPVLSM
jgi:hypothetical protein